MKKRAGSSNQPFFYWGDSLGFLSQAKPLHGEYAVENHGDNSVVFRQSF